MQGEGVARSSQGDLRWPSALGIVDARLYPQAQVQSPKQLIEGKAATTGGVDPERLDDAHQRLDQCKVGSSAKRKDLADRCPVPCPNRDHQRDSVSQSLDLLRCPD